jgi:hypothetical protein
VKQETSKKQAANRALLDLLFDPEDGWQHVPLKRQLTFSRLHGVISLFMFIELKRILNRKRLLEVPAMRCEHHTGRKVSKVLQQMSG